VPTHLEARVAAHCRRTGLLPPGAPVLAMVSGGADSTCLMHVLGALHDGPVGVLVVDHGLRPESGDEAEAVLAAARALGLAAHRDAAAVSPGPGVQERARAARLASARTLAAREGYVRIATGHTASDQAETVLFRLARGAGRTGALGMAPRRDELIRPLLCVTGAETRAWCRA
jgi:tRNA(Ile)-lysidine synthase